MPHVNAKSAPELIRSLAGILHTSSFEVPSRDEPTLELPGVTVATLSNPQARYPLVPGREGNPWVTLAEWPWLIAGRNDVEWLLPYLPRAADFSDDGETWRAGYGPRLRDWPPEGVCSEALPDRVDQLRSVVERLGASSGTRQAVMSLWDPMTDTEPGSKDYPCTDFLQAWIRDGRLNLHVVMRSNDLIWGLSGVNLYNWTMLQELLARCLDVGVGYYVHTATSLHVYERHRARLGPMAARPAPVYPSACPLAIAKTTLQAYSEQCRDALACVQEFRGDPFEPAEIAVITDELGQLQEWAKFMLLHDWLAEAGAPWAYLAHTVERDDWFLALLEYLVRTGRMEVEVADKVMGERSGGMWPHYTRMYVLGARKAEAV